MFYPVRICAAGLCAWSRQFVYVYMSTKNRLFSVLLLENLLLSVICCLPFEFKHLQCGLLYPASCTDRASHTFPNKMQRLGESLMPRQEWLPSHWWLGNFCQCMCMPNAHRVCVLWNSSSLSCSLSFLVLREGFSEKRVKAVLHQIELGLKHQTSNFGLSVATVTCWQYTMYCSVDHTYFDIVSDVAMDTWWWSCSHVASEQECGKI